MGVDVVMGRVRNSTQQTQLTGSNVTLTASGGETTTGQKTSTAKSVGTFKNYVFEVWGTASAFDIQIQAVGPSGTARTINKVFDELNAAYLATTTGDITAVGFYSVSVPAFTTIQVNVVSVTGGNVNVQGGLMQ